MKTTQEDPRKLKANPFNSNRVSPENLEKLEASIREVGFVTAVVVRELDDGTLQILGGQHRVEVAVKMGLKAVPVLNVGKVDEAQARKIGLVDNSRYGTDDTIGLAKLYEEIGMSHAELASFLPYTESDFETVARSVEINLDELRFLDDDEEDAPAPPDEGRTSRPLKTHEVLRFRVTLADAEGIRKLIERTIRAEKLDDGDELTAAGSALALMLLSSSSAPE